MESDSIPPDDGAPPMSEADEAAGIFATASMYWVGVDTDPAATPDQIAEFNDFYTRVHLPEVLELNPGFWAATRYRLETPDPRGDLGPTWLTVYSIDEVAGADRYVARERDPARGRPKYTSGPGLWKTMSPRWRLIWRQVFSIGPRALPPESIFMVGMDAADGAGAPELAAFDQYYNDIHLPEVLDNGKYSAGTRFERYEAFLHQRPEGCPQFCAVYEGEPAGAAGPPPGAPTPGPEAWERRTTTWRLRYRRVGELVLAPDAGVAA